MKSTLAAKLAVSAVLTLLLLVPLAMVRGLVDERRARRDEVIGEVTGKWGGPQTVTGPFLSVAYRVRFKDDRGFDRIRVAHALILPEKLEVAARANPEVRRRGIFETVLYGTELAVEGTFAAWDAAALGIAPNDVLEDGTFLVVGVSDPRGLRTPGTLTWDGGAIPFAPGALPAEVASAGFHAALPRDGSKGPHAFAFRFALQGSDLFTVAPAAGETHVTLRSPWRDPAFTGAFLPDARRIGPDGFAAEWRVSQFARNVPARFSTEDAGLDRTRGALAAAAFGVRFYRPVDVYQQATRALKYAVLFVVLTFTVFFLFEALAGLRLHPFSYLLTGCALALFYLLLLSLSEQTGFAPAYAVSAASTVALVTGYSAAVLGARTRALLVGGLLAALYGYLYVLLRLEDQALLAGSVALFVALAAVMWTTRKVDWYALGAPKPPRAYPPQVPG